MARWTGERTVGMESLGPFSFIFFFSFRLDWINRKRKEEIDERSNRMRVGKKNKRRGLPVFRAAALSERESTGRRWRTPFDGLALNCQSLRSWFNSVLRAVAFHVTQLLSFSFPPSPSLSLSTGVPPSIAKEKYYKSSRLFILSLSLRSSISIPLISSSPPFFFLSLLFSLLRFFFFFSLFRRVMLVAGGRRRRFQNKRRRWMKSEEQDDDDRKGNWRSVYLSSFVPNLIPSGFFLSLKLLFDMALLCWWNRSFRWGTGNHRFKKMLDTFGMAIRSGLPIFQLVSGNALKLQRKMESSLFFFLHFK